uniref:Zinc finger protein n=1 Tax=Ciona intestinalis TaxID=7719 RepID=Q1RPZ3_CIOIN|nr:zinc finger protein [Ciona intestinalis]XP_018673381.1 zinc finger protein isoform X2 [Ciona intestinalis]BAE93292.1 zinc finger protein [Ciona intestinalis]|eukprot:NP_001071906.1 zinc finger protein [Ciona intestinalis]
MGERNKKILLEQLQLPKNKLCSDCNAEGPEWASSNIGVFMCVNCSGIHRMLGTHVSRVKSCRLDQWADEAVQFMCENGNESVNVVLERHVPIYYRKPVPTDPQAYKEHFIHAKYERKEFATPGGCAHYETGMKEGMLWKRGKDGKQFKQRRFVLNMDEGTLKYFVKPDAKEPKQIINLTTLSTSLAPDKINHPHGLQLAFMNDNLTRQIYLYADEAKDAVDWYIVLRASSFHLIRKSYPQLSDAEVLRRLNSHQRKQGWMEKTGPKLTEPYRKRWFSLENRRLLYFEKPLDPYPRGEIYLGSRSEGYMVRDGLPAGQTEHGFGITITTPYRDYLLCCEDKEEQKSWINEIKSITTQPLTDQDNAGVSQA